MRRAAAVDGNQPVIVKALKDRGYSVQSLAAVGDGVPDLLIGRNGRLWLIEIKDPSKKPSQRRLTPAQERWHALWGGHKAVVETVEQALLVVEHGS